MPCGENAMRSPPSVFCLEAEKTIIGNIMVVEAYSDRCRQGQAGPTDIRGGATIARSNVALPCNVDIVAGPVFGIWYCRCAQVLPAGHPRMGVGCSAAFGNTLEEAKAIVRPGLLGDARGQS